MIHKVLIAHAEGEESVAEKLAVPLREAGYEVSHAGTVLVGDSVVEEAARLLAEGSPVVLCGTVKALGTRWARQLVNAARRYPGVQIFPIQVEKDAYIEMLGLDAKVGLYWQDPEGTIRELITSLRRHFPEDSSSRPDPLELQRQLEEYLREQIGFYERHRWTSRAVALRVREKECPTQDAGVAFSKWLSEGNSRVLVLTGDFGSGKTWLAHRFCRNLAADALAGQAQSPIPIFIPLSRLHLRPIRTFEDLIGIASPLAPTFQVVEEGSRPLLVVLDGLDELLVLAGSAPDNARHLFGTIAALIPRRARLLITCRGQVLETIRNWIDLLFEDLSGGEVEDRTSIAIDRALGRGTPVATTFEICDIGPEEADSYLYNSAASELWRKVSNQSAFRELATVPFTLYLLEQALPSLSVQTDAPNLPALYRAAVISWLHRDRGAASAANDLLLTRLEEIAESTFTGLPRINTGADDVLVNAGLLQRVGSDGLTFRHFSLFEYFVACVLHRQLSAYSAALVSRLNLVYMYNVNRFLVPLLLADAERMGRASDRRSPGSRTEVLAPDGRVSVNGFARFILETHWREREGYGIWTTKTAEDGTAPFEGQDPNLQASLGLGSYMWSAMPSLSHSAAPVTGMSWYDAFQCCRWAGGRLPTAEELACVPACEPSDVPYEWSSTWVEERCSRIAVVCTSGPSKRLVQGLNPDMRSQLVGFRVVSLE